MENLAELARIELSSAEKDELLKDMKGILAYVGQVERAKVGETKNKDENYNAWREDELAPRKFSRELIVSQFPDSQDGFLKVKKIL